MNKQRFYELEGLRGVAAIIVVLYHYLLAFYAMMFYGSGDKIVQNMRFEDNLYGNPIMVFLSGTFSVAVFFVLSGFVLTIAFFQTGKLDIIKKLAAKRYLRLMLPALASVLLCYALFKLGLNHVKEAAVLTNSTWLSSTWVFVPHLMDAVISGVWSIFTTGENGYNNVLWTMQTEFTGSFIVFGFAALFSKAKYRWVLYAVLMFVFFNTWLLPFVIGMALADLHANGRLKAVKSPFIAASLVIVALYLGGYPLVGVEGTLYQPLAISGFAVKWNVFYLTIGASILVYAVLSVERLTKFFRHEKVSIIGKYTFSLYLTHLAVLYGFTTFVFVLLRTNAGLGFNTAALISLLASAPIVFGVTVLFERFVDAPSIRFSSYFANIVLGYKQLDVRGHLRTVRRHIRRLTPNRRQLVVREELE